MEIMESTPTKGRPPTDPAIVQEIWRRLEAGGKPKDIADATGVSEATVYRERKAWMAVRAAA